MAGGDPRCARVRFFRSIPIASTRFRSLPAVFSRATSIDSGRSHAFPIASGSFFVSDFDRYRHSLPVLCRLRPSAASLLHSSSTSLLRSSPTSLLRSSPTSSMQTKQTAKKSTGGVAKRKLLVPPTRVLRSQTPLSRQASRSPQPSTDVHMEEVSTKPSGPGQVARQGAVIGNSDGDEVSRLSRLPKFASLMAIPVVPPLL